MLDKKKLEEEIRRGEEKCRALEKEIIRREAEIEKGEQELNEMEEKMVDLQKKIDVINGRSDEHYLEQADKILAMNSQEEVYKYMKSLEERDGLSEEVILSNSNELWELIKESRKGKEK